MFRYSRDKISTLVDFPLEDFDLSAYIKRKEGSTVYDLCAVSHHMGGLGGGHCTEDATVFCFSCLQTPPRASTA